MTSRAPRNGARHPPRGAHCARHVETLLGPPNRPCPGDTGNGPWQPAPRDGRPGEEKRLTADAPHNSGRLPPRDGLPPPLMGGRPRLPPAPGTGSAARGGQGPHTETSRAEGAQATGPGRGKAPDARRSPQRCEVTRGRPSVAVHSPPQGTCVKGTAPRPQAHAPAPDAHRRRAPTARPQGRTAKKGKRPTQDAPRTGERTGCPPHKRAAG